MIVTTSLNWLFLTILPLVAFLYASVGHGGASGYLALMALFSFSTETMKPTALLLNLCVAGISFYHYYKAGFFNKKLFLVFATTSIPMAFLGGLITINTSVYKKILGILLIFSILKMLNIIGKEKHKTIKEIKIWVGLIIGGVIGFFSGLIGIGGGIILTPIILLLSWGKIKESAAVSALFIWVNSAAGLVGQLSNGAILNEQIFILVGFTVFGGFLGSYFGSTKINNQHLRHILATVLALASIKLFII